MSKSKSQITAAPGPDQSVKKPKILILRTGADTKITKEEGFRRIQYFSNKILTGNYTRILVKSKHKSLNDLSID